MRSKARVIVEDFGRWLTAVPSPINHLDSSNVERFYETGDELIATVVGAIERGQHVALAGPRGCGKSYCAGRAAELAQKAGLVPPDGIIKIQGNKELPRDYLIEDDISLEVTDGVVVPKSKVAPLFRLAKRAPGTGLPEKYEGSNKIKIVGTDPNGLAFPNQTLVLFLDEVNRFSDGVLDSLLLLLEEGEAIMGGAAYQLPVVVIMTMNPPGYDSSARTLSPPLSARIGRQYRLLSPQLNVLSDTIAPVVLKAVAVAPSAPPNRKAAPAAGPVANSIVVLPDDVVVRRAAAATLCCWGLPSPGKASFEYLSEEMRNLLVGLAELDTALAAAMLTLTELCHYGPDARALQDWIKAASVAAKNEAILLWQPTIKMRSSHFIQSAITVISHKVQDGFSASSQPGNTRRKEEAIHVIVRTLMNASPEIDKLLSRKLDDEKDLKAASKVIWGAEDAPRLRSEMIRLRLIDDSAVAVWCKILTALPTLTRKVERLLLDEWVMEPRDSRQLAFSAGYHKSFAQWVANQVATAATLPPAIVTDFGALAQSPTYENTLDDYFDRLRCVRDKVFTADELMAMIDEKGSDLVRTRPSCQAIAECLDLFWVRAEHYGPRITDDIESRLTDLNLHTGTRQSIDRVIWTAAQKMAAHRSRGRNTRAALRHLPVPSNA